MSESTEQNPVFHYRAGFRALANSIQKWLMLGGVALSLLGFIGAQFAPRSNTGPCSYCRLMTVGLVGLALLVAGTAWGFYWRKKIRDEFRAKFGP